MGGLPRFHGERRDRGTRAVKINIDAAVAGKPVPSEFDVTALAFEPAYRICPFVRFGIATQPIPSSAKSREKKESKLPPIKLIRPSINRQRDFNQGTQSKPLRKIKSVIEQLGNLKLPIRVAQLDVLTARRYWFVYQNVQSSTGSTVRLLRSPQRRWMPVCAPATLTALQKSIRELNPVNGGRERMTIPLAWLPVSALAGKMRLLKAHANVG